MDVSLDIFYYHLANMVVGNIVVYMGYSVLLFLILNWLSVTSVDFTFSCYSFVSDTMERNNAACLE